MPSVYVPEDWRDYELLDTGEGAKLERWGQLTTVRPDPRVIWKRTLPANVWNKADGQFEIDKDGTDKGWNFKTDPPNPWQVSYGQIKFNLKPTVFKHVGVFPEQAVNWKWLAETIRQRSNSANLKILNLFAYTGGATMACALAGAHVTHVDSSRPAMMWASENSRLAQTEKRIRWIQDDAIKFVKREIRRGVKYDGVIMDPPRFGRGTKGEVWKLLSDLPELVDCSRQVLVDAPLLFLINAYTTDVSCLVLSYLLADVFGKSGSIDSGELGLQETASGKVLPAGIFSRWKAV